MNNHNALLFYNREYLYNIHYLINNGYLNWHFFNFDNCNYINGTNLDFKEFTINNKFLINARNNKILLAEDIISKGILFPFFAYSFNYQNLKNNILVGQGKHRIYSLLLYKTYYNTNINKEFLWIEFPKKLKNEIPPNVLYEFNGATNSIELINTPIQTSFPQLYRVFDRMGSCLSNRMFNNEIFKPNPILNDKNLFQQFISTPLDENNILFQYLPKEYLQN